MPDAIDQERVAEHQRGVCLFGYPFFSEKLLIPGIDPSRFLALIGNDQDGFKALPVMYTHGNRGNSNSKNLRKMIPLPLEETRFGTVSEHASRSRERSNGCADHVYRSNEEENWYVMMDNELADVDDQGWMYSWSFKAKHWKGKYGFVRKRVWVRLPSATPDLIRLEDLGSRHRVEKKATEVAEDISSEENWWDATDDLIMLLSQLQNCKLDRERFQFIDGVFHNLSKDDLVKLSTEPILSRVLGTFQFETSKEKFRNELKARISC
ncbi:Spo73 [Kluyveromyces lactis]|nr:Spo73 [Kluyveromyces lactis]